MLMLKGIEVISLNSNIVNIRFLVGGFWGFDNFNIAVNSDGTALFTHESVGGHSTFPNEMKYSKAETKQFLNLFEKTGVFSWKRYYQPDYIITDGTQWIVEIERKGKRKFIREGDNMFPQRWGSFCALFGITMNEIKTMTLSLRRTDILPFSYYGNGVCQVLHTEKINVDFDSNKLVAEIIKDKFTVFRQELYVEEIDVLSDDVEAVLEQSWNDESIPESSIYTLFVERYDGTIESHSGTYNKNHVPLDWQDVMDSLSQYVPSCAAFSLLNSEAFCNVKGENDLTFYSVEVAGTDKDYYYFSNENALKIGDEVLVPFGKENDLRLGKITNISFFSADKLPYPVEKTKYIERKLEPGEQLPEKTVNCPVTDKNISSGN